MAQPNEVQISISKHLSIYSNNITNSVARGDCSLNVISETIMLPLFQIIFSLPNIYNLNILKMNFPAIDLADDEKRVCIQITSTNEASKIKRTINKFNENKLYEKYDRLIIYILTKKRESYPKKAIFDAVDNKFRFDIKNDVLDSSDLSKTIGTLQIDISKKILAILDANFNDGAFPVSELDLERTKETIYLNWAKIILPPAIYIGEALKDRASISQSLKLSQLTELDWSLYDGKIFTFRDLSDPSEPLYKFVDQETIESSKPDDIANVDDNYKNVVKFLLKKCLSQILYPEYVRWQHESKIFIFIPKPTDGVERRESWSGKKSGNRRVYIHVYKEKKPTESLNHKHFAFSLDFVNHGEEWFMVIKPEWFISSDGYLKDYFAGESVKTIKKLERNVHFFTHVRFILSFLHESISKVSTVEMNHLPSFGELIKFEGVKKFDESKLKNEAISDEIIADSEEL